MVSLTDLYLTLPCESSLTLINLNPLKLGGDSQYTLFSRLQQDFVSVYLLLLIFFLCPTLLLHLSNLLVWLCCSFFPVRHRASHFCRHHQRRQPPVRLHNLRLRLLNPRSTDAQIFDIGIALCIDPRLVRSSALFI